MGAMDIENKKALLRKALSTEQGWINLAKSVKNSSNPNAKQECIDLIKQTYDNNLVNLPTNSGEEAEVFMHDLLISKLEENINMLNHSDD